MLIETEQVSGLILAGGRGRRVDGQDKGLLNFQGKNLIRRQLDWFAPQLDNIIISANRNVEQYQSYGVKVVSDSDGSFSGPLTGISTALNHCITDWLFVQPVDMPFMPLDLIEKLLSAVKVNSGVYYLKSSEREHFLSMLISKNSLLLLNDYLANGGQRVKGFLLESDALVLDLKIDENCFSNLNHLSDYKS